VDTTPKLNSANFTLSAASSSRKLPQGQGAPPQHDAEAIPSRTDILTIRWASASRVSMKNSDPGGPHDKPWVDVVIRGEEAGVNELLFQAATARCSASPGRELHPQPGWRR
jgi:hypothetical protein